MKKIVFLIIATTLFSVTSFAQIDFVYEGERHEFSIGLGGGHSGLRGENPAFRFGGGLNFMYALNFSENWAFVTGLEFGLFRAQWHSDGFLDTILFHSPAFAQFGNDSMLYIADVHGISETQRATFLYIPLMVRARIPIGWDAFYVMGGIKFGIPIVNSYRGRIDSIRTTGFSFHAQQVWPHAPSLGYGTFYENSFNGRLNLWFSAVASLEVGYIYTLRGGQLLHFGAFANFGLNNILRNPDPNMVNRNPANVEVPQIISFSGRYGSLRPRTFGVVVRFGF